jgi:Tfp pilus assembly protein PilE
MKKSPLSNNRGITLAELLISTIIVGIMLGGIFSSYYTLQIMDRGASRRTAVAMGLQAIAEHMRHNAALAHGTVITVAEEGFKFRDNPGNDNYICMRQDVNATPGNLNDDRWACYTMIGNPRAEIRFCYSAVGGIPVTCGAGDTFVGNAFLDWLPPQLDVATGLFSVLIISRFDHSAGIAVDGSGDPTQGDEVNPQSSFLLQVHPDGHSFH